MPTTHEETLESRNATERKIVKRVIDAVFGVPGYSISVCDGEEMVTKQLRSTSEVLGAMFSTDEDILYIQRSFETKPFASVHFIYGNDGWDVVHDYTTNLESLMAPILAYAETLS